MARRLRFPKRHRPDLQARRERAPLAPSAFEPPIPDFLSQGRGSRPSPARKDSNQPKFDLRTQLYWVCGVDLTAVPGINLGVATTIIAEVGPKFTGFETSTRFCSWLRVAPDRVFPADR